MSRFVRKVNMQGPMELYPEKVTLGLHCRKGLIHGELLATSQTADRHDYMT